MIANFFPPCVRKLRTASKTATYRPVCEHRVLRWTNNQNISRFKNKRTLYAERIDGLGVDGVPCHAGERLREDDTDNRVVVVCVCTVCVHHTTHTVHTLYRLQFLVFILEFNLFTV